MPATVLTRSVFSRALHDRWASMLYAGIAIGLLLLLTFGIYGQIDISFYYDLPAALLEPMGIDPNGTGVGGIAYGAMLNLMGAMAVAGVAISIGAASIAGEEADGTLGLLLGNPRSRSAILASKLGALVSLVTFVGLLVWGGAVLVPQILDVDVAGIEVGALVVHLSANALLWGMLAFAVGAWTGKKGQAVGIAASVMVLSWLANSFLPLISETAGDIAKVFPWYYFNGSRPEINGINWLHISVLLGLSTLCGIAAFVGVNRRDLRGGSGEGSLLDRLRDNPRTKAYMDKIEGSALVSGITTKTISDHRSLFTGVLAIIFYLGLLLTPMFNLLPDSMGAFFSSMPDGLLAAIGGADMSTPNGWITGEFLGTVFPIAAITLFASMGARALAGEEDNHTMDLLLANPISRTTVVIQKIKAMVFYAVMIGLATFVGISAGALLGGLDVSIVGVAAASALGALLGLVFGGVSLALSALTGKVPVAIYGAAGLGLLAYFVNSFFPLAESFEPFAVLSPFHYFLSSDPLANGMNWVHAGVLIAMFAVLAVLAIPLFNRRDLRG